MAEGIPGRSQALEEAADLQAVCRERELPGVELFPGNEYYGSDRVLKLYAGVPLERALKVVVPHGIVLNDSYVWQAERCARLPAVFAYSESRTRAYSKSTRKAIFRSAVPFAYAARLVGEADGQRRGTIALPSHSTHYVTAQADYARLADTLVNLGARFQPVTACLYWRDYELGRHRPFVERGLRVVSAGHMYDPAFLFRLAHLFAGHRYAVSNHIGSSAFYAVIAGCSFFLLHGAPPSYTGAAESLRSDVAPPDAAHAHAHGVFSEPHDRPTADQLVIVRAVAGLDHLLDPAALRACLLAAERLDTFGMGRHPQGGGFCFAMPAAPIRALWALLHAARP